MEYFVAETYKNYDRIGEPFYNKNGKLATIVRCKCDRCVKGIYAVGVENGHIKPHPAFGGVCLKCGGTGFLEEEVRLYTKAEYDAMQRNKERAKAKREQEREEKMQAEYVIKKNEWLLKNGFSAEGETYIITGESYSIKDELKAAGWRYDPILKWHKADPVGYEDRVIKIKVEDCFGFSAWGEGRYLPTAKDFIENLLNEAKPHVDSIWVGRIGDELKEIKVKLTSKYSFETRYGMSTAYNFVTEDGNVLVWFSSTVQQVKSGEWCIIKHGIIKNHSEYKNVKQTILTRCKLKLVE